VKISIYTNALKNILPRGLDVFHTYMRPLTKIEFAGDNASKLSLCSSSLLS
jgi:hypothetical protein